MGEKKKKKKDSQKEEKPAGQATKNKAPPLAPGLDPPLIIYGWKGWQCGGICPLKKPN